MLKSAYAQATVGFPVIRRRSGLASTSDYLKSMVSRSRRYFFVAVLNPTHALSSNEIQFDVVSPQPHIAANLSGADIVIIGTYFNKHTYSFVARPGIRSPQDLRGKKVGVLSVVGLNQIVVTAALRH